jgi:cation:H+ antiporter
VRGAVSIARKLNVSAMLIGMTIVAWGTTAPELMVCLEAALRNAPGIAVGNVVGSNIANILLVLGLSAAIFPIYVKAKFIYRDAAVMMGAALLFTVLALSGVIERWQGALMVFALIVFSVYVFYAERRRGKAEGPGELAEEFKDVPQAIWLAILSVLGGMIAIVFGAQLLVGGATQAAQMIGVGEEVIGLTIIAVGTSLPELATAVVAAYRKNSDVALGNVVGANIYNLLAIIGLVSAVTPVPIPQQILTFDLWFMLGATAAMLTLAILQDGIRRWAGVMFLVFFALYTIAQYYGIERILS